MFLKENDKCPVCDKIFAQDDDIVICPVCGTPHHRECYNGLGHCVNKGKHGEGFVYGSAGERFDAQTAKGDNDASASGNSAENKCSECGKEIDKGVVFCVHCGARQNNSQYYREVGGFGSMGRQFTYGAYGDSAQSIDGKKLADIASVVRTNTDRFIRKFSQNRKVSWNWGGFFFGSYYLFFRKMYKPAIAVMALSLAATLVLNGLFAEQIQAVYLAMGEIINSSVQSQNPAAISEQLMADFNTALTGAMPMLLLSLGVNFLISLITAMFSDRMYRTKVLGIIDKVDKSLEDEISGADRFYQINPDMTQTQMRQVYLSSMGGTTLMSPMIAYMVLQMALSLISRL